MVGFQLCRFPKALVDDPPLSPLGKGRFKGVIRLSTAVLVEATFVALTILAMWQAGCGQEDQLAEAVSRSDKSGLSAKDPSVPIDDPDADPPEECMRYVEGYSPAGNDCDDYNPCTRDYCKLNRGSDIGYCAHDPLPGKPCNDWNGCTKDDVCHSTLCYGEFDCDDDNPCTRDYCDVPPFSDPPLLSCQHAPQSGPCTPDGDGCTEDVCNDDGDCIHPVISCDDGSVCTDDWCDPGSGCRHDHIECSDSYDCTDDTCDPIDGCQFTPNTGRSCDDDDPCTTDDQCEDGICGGRALDCSDNNPCTTDTCDPEARGCVNEPVSVPCDDGDPCTVGDYCIEGVCAGVLDPDCPWPSCPTEYIVDGEGYGENFPYARSTRVIIPQGTSGVRVRVYYFSREYPIYSGEPSIYNDQLSFQVTCPNGTIASGSATVNALHEGFGFGSYPGGNFLGEDTLFDTSSLTQTDDSWVDLSATVINIGDGAFGSGVAFLVDCDPIDLSLEGLADNDEENPGGFVGIGTEPGFLRLLTLEVNDADTGTVEFQVVSGDGLIQLYEDAAGTQPVTYLNQSWPVSDLPITLYLTGTTPSETLRDVVLTLTWNGASEDTVKLTVVGVDLNVHNGGSDLDHGDEVGEHGDLVSDGDEETLGGYILVNWDDDDGDGSMNPDGSWSSNPVPDLYEHPVQGEDNLAKLVPTLQPALQDGTVELEITAGGPNIKLWSTNTKQSEIVLSDSTKTWDLADPSQRTDFQYVGANGIWIEGVLPSDEERDVVIVLRYKDATGTELSSDTVKATVVMINLANAVYRDHTWWAQEERGHAALIWKFLGPLTRENLHDDTKFLLIEMSGPTDSFDLSTMTQDSGRPPYGCFTNPIITYQQRLMVLQAAKSLVARGVGYTMNDALNPHEWDGQLGNITSLRCDGLVEVCYEINGVEVWGMTGRPPDGGTHYDITDDADFYSYNGLTGEWDEDGNEEPDNLEEHNDFDNVGWYDTLMPATQCGHVIPADANTRFQPEDLCVPVGSKGGNS